MSVREVIEFFAAAASQIRTIQEIAQNKAFSLGFGGFAIGPVVLQHVESRPNQYEGIVQFDIMKTVGLIGGIGPESTIEYYRSIISGYREKNPDGSYPSIIVNSVDLTQLVDWMGQNELGKVVEYLVTEVEKLVKAGADFGALASNTPHIVFNEIQRQTSLRLISIVEATCERVQSLGFKRVALFGTRYTMQGHFYPEVFSKAGIDLIVPNPEEQTYIHEKYFGELLNNIFIPETRDALLAIVDNLKARHGIEGLILGGTELPLILKDDERKGVRLLDTTRIHCDRIVRELLA